MFFSQDAASSDAPLHPIFTCPRCRSAQVWPVDPIPNAALRHAAEMAWDDWWGGRRAMAVRTISRWLCIAGANALRDNLACDYCGHSFQGDRS